MRCTEPSAWAHVGPETAFAALSGLASGRPQVVDVSAQEVVMIASMGHVGRFPRTKVRGKRSGANVGITREIWPCLDGYVSFGLRGGKARVANLQTITRLVDEDGLATPALTERDWTSYNHNAVSTEELDAIAAPIAAYFLRHPMAELYEIACATNLMLAPANSPRQLVESRQLAERDFFVPLAPATHFPRSFVHVTSPGDAVARPGPEAPARAAPATGLAGAWPARAAHRPNDAPATGAWHGTHILEFGTGAAGPIAVRYFAEHGATVVRVESRVAPRLPAHLRARARQPVRARRVGHVRRPQRGQARGDAQPQAPRGGGPGQAPGGVGRRRGRELRAPGHARLRARLRRRCRPRSRTSSW